MKAINNIMILVMLIFTPHLWGFGPVISDEDTAADMAASDSLQVNIYNTQQQELAKETYDNLIDKLEGQQRGQIPKNESYFETPNYGDTKISEIDKYQDYNYVLEHSYNLSCPKISADSPLKPSLHF